MAVRVKVTRGRVFAGLVTAGLAALLVGWSGLISIAASSGHFAPVGWFLHWTMGNAVDTQSSLISVPEDIDLSDPSLLPRAAGHFATGCAPCHGAPGVPQSPVALSMTPHPPRLSDQVGEWDNEELYWIVLHGIKYTGMPAWPTQEREDEIWPMVAFLRALPEMSPEEYADLALGGGLAEDDLEAGADALAGLDGIHESALEDCARCHGRDGYGTGPDDAVPVIAGQPEEYLFATLKAFAFGVRHSGYMQPPAKRYDEETLAALARHYSEQPLPPAALVEAEASPDAAVPDPSEPVPPDREEVVESVGIVTDVFGVDPAAASGFPHTEEGMMALGRRIALEGLPNRKIPACQSCHSAEERRKNPYYPYLGGQPEWYLSTHLHLWAEGERGGTEYAHLMDEFAINMTEEQIEAVSAWYAAQPLGR